MNDLEKVIAVRKYLNAIGQAPILELTEKFKLNSNQLITIVELAGNKPPEFVAVFLPDIGDMMTRTEICRMLDIPYRPPVVGQVE